MKLLELKDVSVAYEDGEALHGVNLTIDSADFLGVIGPNGGGKTTLVKAILGPYPTRDRSTMHRSSSMARSA